MFLKKSQNLNTKFPFKTAYFLGFGGLTTSSYMVYDYTTIGNMDLWNIYLMYIQGVPEGMCQTSGGCSLC